MAIKGNGAAKEIVDIIQQTTEKTKLVVSNMNSANEIIGEQKQVLSITQDAFDKIKITYNRTECKNL